MPQLTTADRIAADLLANGPATALAIAQRTGMQSAGVRNAIREAGARFRVIGEEGQGRTAALVWDVNRLEETR